LSIWDKEPMSIFATLNPPSQN